MKTVIASALITLAFTAASQASSFPISKDTNGLDGHERGLVKLCTALASGNKISLHNAMKQMNVDYKELQEGLECNGQDPITFAMLHDADGLATQIAKRNNMDVDTVLASR